MSRMVTRCPQCHTSFRVTDEHLKVAKGAVRCGSCLHVFQAAQHWIGELPAEKPTAVHESDEHEADDDADWSAATDAAGTGRFRFDQSMIDSAPPAATAARMAEPSASATTPVPPARTVVPEPSADDEERFGDDSPLDEEDIEAILGASGPAEPPADPGTLVHGDAVFLPDQTPVAKPLAPAEAEGEEDFDAVIARHMAPPVQAKRPEPVSDESWAKDLLAELEDEAVPRVDLSAEDHAHGLLVDLDHHQDVARRDLGIDHAMLDDDQPSRAAMIAHIEPAPLNFGKSYDYASLKGGVLRLVLAAFLLLLLVGQYVFFNFDALSQQAVWRAGLDSLCGTGVCHLPPLDNRKAIKVTNMVVRKHATVANALQVDAIIINTADSEQPFPRLDLYFTDMVQLPVASRRFEPAEYLAGELTGQTLMPPGQPVHIAFEIVNPGDKAVGWSLQVVRDTAAVSR